VCSGIGGVCGRTLHPHEWRCRHAISDSKKPGDIEGGGERSGCGWLGLLCVEIQKLVLCSVGAALNGVYSFLELLRLNRSASYRPVAVEKVKHKPWQRKDLLTDIHALRRGHLLYSRYQRTSIDAPVTPLVSIYPRTYSEAAQQYSHLPLGRILHALHPTSSLAAQRSHRIAVLIS